MTDSLTLEPPLVALGNNVFLLEPLLIAIPDVLQVRRVAHA
jgi:hypothetical protein